MLTNEIAIIGLDGQIDSQIDSQEDSLVNIDQVARALYLGKLPQGTNQQAVHAESLDESSLVTAAVQSTKQMLSAINANEDIVAFADVDILLVNEGITESITEGTGKASEQKALADANVKSFSQLTDALAHAIPLLEANKVVAVVGINQASDTSSTAQASDADITNSTINSNITTNTISFDSHFSRYQAASGIASILLAPLDKAETEKLTVYATLTDFAVSEKNKQAMQAAVNQSLTKIADEKISLIEVSALADKHNRALESEVLLQAYGGSALSRAVSCARSVTGEGGALSQLLGLVRTVIALQQRYIPGITDWQSVSSDQQSKWQNSSFYFPTESRPSYPNGSAQQAAYSCLSKDSYSHFILTEHNVLTSDVTQSDITQSDLIQSKKVDYRPNGFLANSPLSLVLICGNDEESLQTQLVAMLESIAGLNSSSLNLKSMADQHYQQYLLAGNKNYTISLLAESFEELIKEIKLAQQGISRAFLALTHQGGSNEMQWKTPKGSYFTAEPVTKLVRDGETDTVADKNQEPETNQSVCFMYPGIGATYVGLGRDLLHLFPQIYPDVIRLADDIGHSLKDKLLNPRSINRLDFNALKQRDLALRGNLADIAEAGVAFACLFSKIFTDVFKVNATFATGYSMGEVSMYAALGCWQKPSVMSARLANSQTFNQRLSGELLTLRDLWGLTTSDTHREMIWETYSIKATLAEVEAACVGEYRVYCTIINTLDSVVLAGYPSDCLRVIDKLGVRAMPLNMANAIHSAPAKAEYDEMVSLYTMAVNDRINTKLYSSSCYLPVPQLSKAIAHSIAKCLCERVDFPRLVNSLYNQGARVFIEMGAGRSLCSWVDKTLQQQQKIDGIKRVSTSVPVNAKGVSDELTYFRAIAKLASQGVKLDLNNLFYGSMIIKKTSHEFCDEPNKR